MSARPRTAATTDLGSTEIERIRSEYARRAREIPDDFYSWTRDVNFYTHCQTARAALRALVDAGTFPLAGRTVLDAGCGAGVWLLEFAQWGADRLHGIDLNPARLELATRRLPNADLRCGDARALPWPDATFDVVSQFTVFTSILDPSVKQAVATEMLRVLKPGGVILWYDFRFNNPANSHVRGIEGSEIRSLFRNCDVTLKRVTLAPPIARRVVPVTWTGAALLEQIPWLRTHYVAVVRKSIHEK